MSLSVIIIFILYVIAAVFIFKLIKSAVKAIFLISAIALIILALGSFFIYKDVADMRENWPDSDKLVLLKSNDVVSAGFISTLSEAKAPQLLSSEEISSLDSSFQEDDLESMIGDNYMMLIMSLRPIIDAIEADEITFQDWSFTKDDFISIIDSEDPMDLFIDRLMLESSYPEELREQLEEEVVAKFKDSTHLKTMAFEILVSHLFREKGTGAGVFIIQQYKEGKVIVYPQTTVFRTIKLIPDFMIDMAAGIADKKIKQG